MSGKPKKLMVRVKEMMETRHHTRHPRLFGALGTSDRPVVVNAPNNPLDGPASGSYIAPGGRATIVLSAYPQNIRG